MSMYIITFKRHHNAYKRKIFFYKLGVSEVKKEEKLVLNKEDH